MRLLLPVLFAAGWLLVEGAPSWPPVRSQDWTLAVVLGAAAGAWRPRAAWLGLLPLAGAFRFVLQDAGGALWGLATVVGFAVLLEVLVRAPREGRSFAGWLLVCAGVDALALVATGSLRLGSHGLLLAVASAVMVGVGRAAVGPWVVLHLLLMSAGLHRSELGLWTALVGLLPLAWRIPQPWAAWALAAATTAPLLAMLGGLKEL